MLIKDWLSFNTQKLQRASVESASLDAQLLLSDLLNKDRSWILAHPEYKLNDNIISILSEKINRRQNHEPIAYIRGLQEFYGRDFVVSPDTLTPRPETETIVELGVEYIASEKIQSVADIGTGSGCIIISLALESNYEILYTGYDVSLQALRIAQKNAKTLGATATFEQDDITKKGKHSWQKAEMIVANLPYVPTDFHINLAATHEPESAIFGGEDGLDYYRALFDGLTENTKYVITESLPPQHNNLAKIAYDAGFKLMETKDFVQLFKLI